MADRPQVILVQSDLRPAYYDSFQCLAADCRYSCCEGWRISFDKADYLRLKQLKCSPELDATLKGGVRRIKKGVLAEKFYGEFDMAGMRCPLLREDGLCALQLERGHEALPLVCKEFPRCEGYPSSGFLERSLSPACEGVLELLWNLPEGLEFRSDPLPKEGQRTIPFQDPIRLRVRFQDIRSQCIDFLQDRRYTLPQRILLMGLALKMLVDGERDIDRWLAHARFLADDPETAKALSVVDAGDGLPLFLTNNMGVLQRMRNEDSIFASVPDELSAALGFRYRPGSSQAVVSTVPYLEARARYEARFADRAYFMENLMVALHFHFSMPELGSGKELWESYVDFCSLYSFYRFLAVVSCREGVEDAKAEWFRLILFASRELLHSSTLQKAFRDELFQHDSATLAHMAILLGN